MKMKAMFAWMSLLASMANLFVVASGQPEKLTAILKTSMPEVSVWLFCINFPNIGSNFTWLKYLSQADKNVIN